MTLLAVAVAVATFLTTGPAEPAPTGASASRAGTPPVASSAPPERTPDQTPTVQSAPAPAQPPANAASGFRHLPNARNGQATHHDPAPPGVDVTRPVSTAALLATVGPAQPAGPVTANTTYQPSGTSRSTGLGQHVAPHCSGTGEDGNRKQLVYAVEEGTPNRYADVLAVIRDVAANIDDTFAVSSRETNGGRRVRWVTEPDCTPVVLNLTVPVGALDASLSSTALAMKNAGYNRVDRHYLIFADANQMCGQGDLWNDPAVTNNPADGRYAMYARVDTACWTGSTYAAHELMHNLGAVQQNAPHATDNYHCADGADVMCYADGSSQPQQQICAIEHRPLFDCNHDDYFHTDPPAGNYLATNWNTAMSSFLAVAPVLAPAPTVTVAVSKSQVESGEPFTLTASSPDPAVTFAWSEPRGFCPPGGETTPTVTARCQARAGDVQIRVTALSPDGQSTVLDTPVTVTDVPPPSGTVTVDPASPVNGQPFTVALTPSGRGPFSVQWSPTECLTGATSTALSQVFQCPNDSYSHSYTYSYSGYMRVTGPDGQWAAVPFSYMSSPAPASSPSPTATPPPTATATSEPSPSQTASDPPSPTPTATATPTPTASATPAPMPLPTLTASLTGPASMTAGTQTATYTGSASRSGASLTFAVNRNDCTLGRPGVTTLTVRCPSAARGTVTVTFSAYDPRDGARAAASRSTRLVSLTSWANTVRTGRPDVITGTLKRPGGVVGGQVVRLQYRVYGTSAWGWAQPAVRTASNGTVMAKVQPKRRMYYRWVFTGTAVFKASSSPAVYVTY